MPFDNETCFFSSKKLKKPDEPIILREIDLTYELCNMMLPHKRLPRCFAMDAAGEFRLADEYEIEGKCNRYSSSYIPDLIDKFSECREKLQEIRILVESPPPSRQLASILVHPIKVVLRKFLDDSIASTQSLLTTSQDLVSVSNFLIGFKPRLDKTHSYFGSVLRLDNGDEYLTESATHLWDKFIMDLCHSGYLAIELPIWTDLFAEMINLLGQYFNQICQDRELSIPDGPEPFRGAVRQSLHSNFHSSREDGQFSRRSTYSECSTVPLYRMCGQKVPLFRMLWTEKLKEDLLLAIRYSENIHVTVPMSFLQIYEMQLNEMKKRSTSGQKVAFLKELLMRSVTVYKAQYSESILRDIRCNGRIGVILSEIKELYTLRAFCRPLSDFFDEYAESDDVYVFDQVLENTLDDVKHCCVNTRDSAKKEERGWNISLVHDDEKPWKFKLDCDIAWPLSCILDNKLLDLLSRCLELCQEIFRAYAIAVKLLRKGCLRLVSDDGNARSKRLLLHSSMRSLSTIYVVLQNHIDQLIAKTKLQVLECNSLTEVEKHIGMCRESLGRILNYDILGKSSYIHPMIHKLCEMIPKIYAAEAQSSVKNAKNVGKNLKVLGRILTMLQSGSLAPGPGGVGQEIAARLPRTSSAYKQ